MIEQSLVLAEPSPWRMGTRLLSGVGALLLVVGMLGGCASTRAPRATADAGAPAAPATEAGGASAPGQMDDEDDEDEGRRTQAQRLDPWEHWNRRVFAFNESLDRNVLEPVARTYAKVLPQPVRTGISNFFGNFSDAWSAVNNFLQWKITNGFTDVMRVGTNTLFGVGGIFDVASDLGMEKHNEDFGQTLGHWGVGPGAYMVLPLLGPSSVREAVALPLDRAVSPALLLHDGTWQWSILTLQLVNTRAQLLGATRLLDEIALDKYSLVRNAYLQRRRSLVYDGDPPEPDPPKHRQFDQGQPAP